jgi:COX assembly protein 1
VTGRIPNQVEDALRVRLRKYAYKKCGPELKDFSECSKDKTITVLYACRDQQTRLYECINNVTNDENMEKLRQAYLRGDLYRKKSYRDLSAELEQKILSQKQQDS